MTNIWILLLGPSGVGKTTIAKKVAERDNNIIRTVSYTTRFQRPHEVDGVDYNFITTEMWLKKDNRVDFIANARVGYCYYGIDKYEVGGLLEEGYDIISSLEPKGLFDIQNTRFKDYILPILVLPESIKDLFNQLNNRQFNVESELFDRVSGWASELNSYKDWDGAVYNDCLEDTVEVIEHVVDIKRENNKHKAEVKDHISELISQINNQDY